MNSIDSKLSKFIVYACPTGELNTQIETFFQRSYEAYGKNTAHDYMPHCSLTGFFPDNPNSIPFYLEALERAYQKAKHLSLNIQTVRSGFNDDWHGIELQAEGVKQLVKHFAQTEASPTRKEDIRLKDWLHLSLAYGFESEFQERLETLARETIDITAEVAWELRFYQKLDRTWNCLQSWNLEKGSK